MRAILLISLAFLALRLASLGVVSVPGYTDAYYYVDVARNLADGRGLVADFLWSPVESPALDPLPVPSNRFWMPLASLTQAAGIVPLGALLGPFRAAQLTVLALAALVPMASYLAARSLGARQGSSLLAATLVGLGGLFAPAWVTLDSYALSAVLGTVFFASFGRAAGTGDLRSGALAGLVIGLLFLARAETALFGLAPLALLASPRTRLAGIAGSALALAIGLGWLARAVALGGASETFARSALLVRYDELFALRAPTLEAFLAAWPAVLGAKVVALGTNTVTAVFALALLPAVTLVAGARSLWHRPEARAFGVLAVLVLLAQSLVWTLHSTRGSYVHSLAAFLPFGFALAAAGADSLLAGLSQGARTLAVGAAVVASVVMSAAALVQFDATFVRAEAQRRAAADSIPAGTFLAIDASAWRWIAGRAVVITPSEGLEAAACVATRYGARSIVLEQAHFTAYDALYRDRAGVPWLGAAVDRGGIVILPIVGTPACPR